MQAQSIKITKLVGNTGQIEGLPKNPRLIRDEKFAKLVKSIKDDPEMMELRELLVMPHGKQFVVIAGNMRLRAMMDLGYKDAPCKVLDKDTSVEKLKAYTIKDNVGFGEHDWDALANEWDAGKLDEWGLDVPTSFGDETEIPEETNEDVVHEVPSNPVTVKGDVWAMGKHRILCGDCRDFNDVEKLLKGAKINVAVTSPPYASQRKYDETSGFKPIPPDEYVKWYRDVASNIMAHLASDGSYFCNIKEHCEDGQRSLYVKDLTLAHVREWGWRFVDEFIWNKNGVPGSWPNRFRNDFEPIFHFSVSSQIRFTPEQVGVHSDEAMIAGERSVSNSTDAKFSRSRLTGPGIILSGNVLRIGCETAGVHTAPFPVALAEFFIKAFSDKGDTIYDPFMGSGTTLIAAEKNGRIGYGTEISPGYCDVIVKRWQEFTGQKAVHEASGKTFAELSEAQVNTV